MTLQSRRGSDASSTEHPDAERLAAYIDRTLDSSARAEVEGHLADCEECRTIVVDSVALPTEKPGRRKTHYVYGAAGLAAAAVVVLAVWSIRQTWPEEADQPRLEALVVAVASEPTRPIEGRLSPGFPYRPAPAVTHGTGTAELLPGTRMAVAEAEADVQDDRSVIGRWTLGIARLIERDYDAAIAALEDAARADASRSALHSDLSAAYLARARDKGRIADLEGALAAAERALLLDEGNAQALFNMALALQAREPALARDAWRAVASGEGDSPWGVEASMRSRAKR